MRYLLLLSCLLIGFTACENKVGKKKIAVKEKDSFYKIEQKFKSFPKSFCDSVERLFDPGFSGTVLIYKDGHLYKKALGYRDINRSEAMQTGDLFQLASVSKTVTATAVMLLIKDGKLQLDALAAQYLKEFPYPSVTIRQLLSHRSGLSEYMYYTDTAWRDSSKYMDNEDFYRYMCKYKPAPYNEPNVTFDYCNSNYAFLALIVERVSGMSFARFVEERIFKPAGMRNSFFLGHQNKRIKNKVLIGRYENYVYTEKYCLDGILGDKSLFSNVDDMLAFHLALSEGRLVTKEQLELMQTPTYKFTYNGSYGLGFRLKQTPNGQWTYHNGWWRGFWTSFWNRFDQKACFIVLTNNRHSRNVDKHALADMLVKCGF